jgi:hypothetical protein
MWIAYVVGGSIADTTGTTVGNIKDDLTAIKKHLGLADGAADTSPPPDNGQ